MSQAIAEFGRMLGQDHFTEGAAGQASRLEWADGTRLEIESREEEWLLCLAFPAPHAAGVELLEALHQSDLRRSTKGSPLQVGLVGQGNEVCLLVTARVRAQGADAEMLHRAYERCVQWRHRWESACRRGGQP